MKKKEWNEGLNYLDPALVEAYVRQKDAIEQRKAQQRSLWLRLGALAACFALIVGAIFILPEPKEDLVGEAPLVLNQPIPNPSIRLDATVFSEKLSGSNSAFVVGSSPSGGGGFVADAAFVFQFYTAHHRDFAVRARVVKNYPDIYYNLGVSSPYRLVLMECLGVINGENVPQYFLYRMDASEFVDLSAYESLLISMEQCGTEHYVMKNGTQNKIEAFEPPVFESAMTSFGKIIAFRDGVFDESLWQNENKSWDYAYRYYGKRMLDDPEKSDLVVKRGDLEWNVIRNIQKRYEESREDKRLSHLPDAKVVTLQFSSSEAQAAVEYVKPFTNGVFSQSCTGFIGGSGRIFFRRYINGCQTEETVTIDLATEEVTYSEVQYTQKDLSNVENLPVHLAEMALAYAEQIPTPPHTTLAGKTLVSLNLYAWYAKVDGKLYGVIKTHWCYRAENDRHIEYYDEAFVLYDMEAGTATDVSREELIATVGDRNVYLGPYDVGEEQPLI